MHKTGPYSLRINPIWPIQINQEQKNSIQKIKLLNKPQLLQEIDQSNSTSSLLNQIQLNLQVLEDHSLVNQLDNHQHRFLSQFMYIASRAHFLFKLKFSTLFLAYALAEKTVHMVRLLFPYDYWMAACLYLSIKYQQVQKLKFDNIIHLLKMPIERTRYYSYEIQILKQINQNLNIVSFHTLVRQLLPLLSRQQTHMVFYILELTLFNRKNLQKYSPKETIISIIFVLFPYKNLIAKDSKSKPYGIQYQILKKCSQEIQKIKSYNQINRTFLYQKYERYNKSFSQKLRFNGLKKVNSICQNVQDGKTKKIKKAKISLKVQNQ